MTQVTVDEAMRQAVHHHRAGRLTDAEGIYKKVLALDPNQPDALYLSGALNQQMGRHTEGVPLLKRAVAAVPGNAAWRSTYGVSLALTGDVDEAIHQFEQAIILDPNLPDAHLNLGNAFNLKQRQEDAIRCFRHALTLRPDYPEAHFNLANALKTRDGDEAIEHYRHVLRTRPNVPVVHLQLAETLLHRRRLDEAIAAFGRVIEMSPLMPEPHLRLGIALHEAGRREAAIEAFREAIRLDPDSAEAHFNLALALEDGGTTDERVRELREVLRIDPLHRLAFDRLLYLLHYVAGVDPKELADLHVEWARRFERPLMPTNGVSRRAAAEDGTPRRLRIGYVSRDFRAHPVSYFFEPVVTHHDRNRFEVFCYADDIAPDAITERLRRASDVWRDTARMTEEQLAEQVRNDNIDILVDLAGHTEQNRLLAFARRPAPMQVTWLGYPDTTGMSSIDYRITDAHLDPQEKSLGPERLLKLPVAACYQPPTITPKIGPPPSEGHFHITFGCLNLVQKLSGPLIELWSRVLVSVPESRLLLKSRGLERDDVRRRLVDAFALRGVAANRLEMLPATPSFEDHLKTHNRIDIALDTQPFAGTSTTCEALWMGVPVVTLAGRSNAGRIGVSLLHAAGLADYVAHGTDEYVQIAVALAVDLELRRELRRDLRERLKFSSLFNAKNFTATYETALLGAFERHP